MSRSGSKGAVHWHGTYPSSSTFYCTMPTLKGKVKELYELAYGSETYDRYCDTVWEAHGTMFKNLMRAGTERKFPFVHKPHHDVESLCWVLIYMLFHVQPLERTERVNLPAFWTVRDFFHEHTEPGPIGDTRSHFVFLSIGDITNCLDPKLASVTQLIRNILQYIEPEYELLDPPLPPEYLHEVIRRLLLEAIYKMKDPIALDPGKLRPLAYPTESTSEDDPCDVDVDVPGPDGNWDDIDVDREVTTETNKLKRKMDVEPDDAAHQDTKRPRRVDSNIM